MANTGGSWNRAIYIMANYGFLTEAQFGLDEIQDERSGLQAQALAEVQKALLEGGELFRDEDRSVENVTKFLNRVFKVDIETLRSQALANLPNVDIANGPVNSWGFIALSPVKSWGHKGSLKTKTLEFFCFDDSLSELKALS